MQSLSIARRKLKRNCKLELKLKCPRPKTAFCAKKASFIVIECKGGARLKN